ncbi:MAG: transposase [Mariprofundaceae bacterium]
MARPPRIEHPGAVYFVSARGAGGRSVFASDADRTLFLDILELVLDRFGWVCHAYCLSDDRYHLLIETSRANISRGMRQLNGLFTQRINRRHGRAGHVFQGRFKAVVIEKEAWLLELCRHVALIPVQAGLAGHVEGWSWSSYAATAGLVPEPDFLTVGWILEEFGSSRKAAQAEYRQFVEDGVGAPSPMLKVRDQIILGSDAFRNGLLGGMKIGSTGNLSLAAIEARYTQRGEWIAAAYRDHGYIMQDIADHAGLHISSVSNIIKAWEQR